MRGELVKTQQSCRDRTLRIRRTVLSTPSAPTTRSYDTSTSCSSAPAAAPAAASWDAGKDPGSGRSPATRFFSSRRVSSAAGRPSAEEHQRDKDFRILTKIEVMHSYRALLGPFLVPPFLPQNSPRASTRPYTEVNRQ